ncbi:MAG: hypothetical protein R6U89_07910 [Dehalococcoidia bacterium]
MFRRISPVVVLTFFIIGIGAGFGIGYAVERSHSSSLESDLHEKEQIVAQHQDQISSLASEKTRLQSDLEIKQDDCDWYEKELENTSNELNILQTNYNALTRYYQTCQNEYTTLQTRYEALQEACQGATVEEIMSLHDEILSLKSQNSWLRAEVTQLENQLAISPSNTIAREDVWGNPKFKSTSWQGREYELSTTLEKLAEEYASTHLFIEGEFDCNDMAVGLWNTLTKNDIKSVIVIGDLNKTDETLAESNHAWLYVFDAEGKVIYLEPTTGEIIYGRLLDGRPNPDAAPYREGFIYEKPSDLWADACPSNHIW